MFSKKKSQPCSLEIKLWVSLTYDEHDFLINIIVLTYYQTNHYQQLETPAAKWKQNFKQISSLQQKLLLRKLH
jgi:hypothetical protein